MLEILIVLTMDDLSYCNDWMNNEHFLQKSSVKKKEQLVRRQIRSFDIYKLAKSYTCNLRFCVSE